MTYILGLMFIFFYDFDSFRWIPKLLDKVYRWFFFCQIAFWKGYAIFIPANSELEYLCAHILFSCFHLCQSGRPKWTLKNNHAFLLAIFIFKHMILLIYATFFRCRYFLNLIKEFSVISPAKSGVVQDKSQLLWASFSLIS